MSSSRQTSATPPSIAAGIAQNVGYSKSILSAIKGLNSFEKNSSSDTLHSIGSIDNNSQTEDNTEAVFEEDAGRPSTAPTMEEESPERSAALKVCTPRSIRKRKSLSCDLTESPQTMSSAVGHGASKGKSVSVGCAIDRVASSSPSLKEGSVKKTDSLSICSTSTRPHRRAASTASTNSSFKDKDSFIEPIPFAICAAALYACTVSDLDTLKRLLKENPFLINYAYPHCYRLTCMHVAAKSGDVGLIRFLAAQGANLNARDDNMSTPAHLAARANRANVVHLLQNLGADTKLLDGNGKQCYAYLTLFVPSTAAAASRSDSQQSLADDLSVNLNVSATSGLSASFSLSHSFHRMGSLRPLKKRVNKVRDLFVGGYT